MLCFWNQPFYLLGASGSVFGITLSLAMLFPEARFGFIFFPAPVKAPTLIIIYTLLEICSQIFAPGSGVAHLAHLGGFIGGYIAVKIWFGRQLAWDPLRPKNKAPKTFGGGFTRPEPPPFTGSSSGSVSPAELDALLDKVSREGINSLSEYELSRLRQAREEMRGK